MSMRILLVTVIYYISGIVFWETKSPLPLIAGAALLFPSLKGWNPKRCRYILFLVYLTALLLGCVRCAQSMGQQQAALLSVSDSDRVTVRGIITQKNERSDLISYTVRTASGNLIIYPTELTASYEENASFLLSVPIGAEVSVTGEGEAFDPAPNEGGFDLYQYYRSMHIWYRIKNAEVIVLNSPRIGFREMLWQLSRRIAAVYDSCLAGEESGLVAAITLGDKSSLDADAKQLFQLSGLGHILAVSGTHVTVLSMLALALLKKCHASRAMQSVVCSMVCIGYCVMTGMTVSGSRACMMFVIAMAASALGEAYDSLTGIAAAALLILWFRPFELFNSGFQLSFIAAAGVVLGANPMSMACRRYFKKRWDKSHPKEMSRGDHWRPGIGSRIAESLVFALGIQLVTLPVIAYTYYEIPVYVVLLNTILLPVLPVLLCTGLTGGLLGLAAASLIAIPSLQSVLHIVMKLLFGICHLILYIYEFAAAKSLSFPFARLITGKPPVWIIILFYTMLFINVWAEVKEHKKASVLRKSGFCIMLLLTVSFPLPHVKEITMIDVGQGDGIYICSGDGRNYMIDGGSTSVDDVGQYRILPFLKSKGVRKIDTWFISHTDLDHCNGLLEALEDHYPIGQIVYSATMKSCYDEEQNKKTAESSTSYISSTYSSSGIYEQIEALAGEQGIPVKVMKQGDVVGNESMSFTCLYPGKTSSFSGVNENSLVLLAEAEGMAMLLGGDIGEEQEKAVLREPEVQKLKSTDILVMKADHHGSNYSNGSDILEAAEWDQVWISAGKNNRYHHPGKDAVERIKNAGIPYLCTIYTDQISLKYIHGKWKEYTMR